MDVQDREKILFLYHDGKRMVEAAEADPAKLGLENAKETLRNAEKLMRDYGITPDA